MPARDRLKVVPDCSPRSWRSTATRCAGPRC